MTDSEVLAIAQAAGLATAAQAFPQDVLAAAQAAWQARQSLRAPQDPTVEPWPPMRPAVP